MLYIMIIKKEKDGNVTIYYLDKDISDEKMDSLKNTYVKSSQINLMITDDADVYNADGSKLLICFRKHKLTESKTKVFYDNVIKFAMSKTTNRGSTSGSKKKHIGYNPKIMTNIIGYFDKFGPAQKQIITRKHIKNLLGVRETRFTMDFPDKFKQMLPLVKEIDDCYKLYTPEFYAKQRKKANQTPFKIQGTAFTTITTNVNFRTSIHKDRGDDEEGFGNLVVIEDGKYTGAETCLPQYGVGVDVRTGDVLFMNVHEWHGNLPMKAENADVKRLSIVCYLRRNLWEKTKHKTKKFMIAHNKRVKGLRGLGEGMLGLGSGIKADEVGLLANEREIDDEFHGE
jgi:Oxygenase domain of the 2OGFeDO superfamily